VIHKKRSRSGSLSYEDAVLEALCFGWIDSTPNRLDDETYKLWLAPRKPKGVWSAINKERVVRLINEGLMQPPGSPRSKRRRRTGRGRRSTGAMPSSCPTISLRRSR